LSGIDRLELAAVTTTFLGGRTIDRCSKIIELVGRGDAAELFGGLAKRAAELVIANRDMIDKLAQKLDAAGEITGEQIDAVLLEG